VLAPLGLRELGQQQRKFDVLERRQHRNQVVHLKNESHVPRAPLRQFARRHVRDFIAVHGDAAR
jgi:hypothetical protein